MHHNRCTMFTVCKGKDKIATFGVSILWPQQRMSCAEVEEFLSICFISHLPCPKPTDLSIMIGRFN
uniref:Uncharacterized protein n=1 Tax=Arundo donax TaxID=35708 RepID=A0A0A9UZP9_ARUDO